MRALISLTTRSAIMRSRSDSSSSLERLGRLADRQVAQVGDVAAVDGDRQRQRLQPGAAARGARHLAHVALDLLAHRVALGFGVPPLQVRHHALVRGRSSCARGRSGCGT